MSSPRLRLERWSVDRLTAHPGNAKQHPDRHVDDIARSINRFGFNDPIGVTPDGRVVEGHGRLLAARELGVEHVPVLILEGMDEREIDLYRIAHNKIALTTGFNVGTLVEELRALVGEDITLSMMGFDEHQAVSLLGDIPDEMLDDGIDHDAAVEDDQSSQDGLEYVVIWEDVRQREEVTAFLRSRRQTGETVAGALVRLLSEALEPTQEEAHEHVNA